MSLKVGDVEDICFEWIVWLKIVGVHFHLLNVENFTTIANRFGKNLEANGCKCNLDYDNISTGLACIRTTSRYKINDEVTIVVGDKTYIIGVFETNDDWHPFDDEINSHPLSQIKDHRGSEWQLYICCMVFCGCILCDILKTR